MHKWPIISEPTGTELELFFGRFEAIESVKG